MYSIHRVIFVYIFLYYFNLLFSVSDDCSSLNSSPWTNEHIRKQSVPGRNKSFVLQSVSFYFCSSAESVDARKRVRHRRNPFICIAGEPIPSEKVCENSHQVSLTRRKIKYECVGKSNEERKDRLEKWILLFGMKCGVKLETGTSIKVLYEKPPPSLPTPPTTTATVNVTEIVDPNFVSPRKRYLRQMESDQDNIHRKKLHSGANSVPHNSGERASSSSTSTLPHPQSNRSAINSHTSASVYSIESILNHGSVSRKNDSFLRTLLKPEPKSTTNYRSSPLVKERDRMNDVQITPVKVERHERSESRGVTDGLDQQQSQQRPPSQPQQHGGGSSGSGGGHTDKTDSLIDLNRLPTDRYDFTRPGPMAGLYTLPYLDPRYMMLQSLAPTLVPSVSSQQTEVAQAFATAAAAAAAAAAAGLSTYPLGHLHQSLTSAQYPHFLPGGYTPPTSIASQLLRPQPHSSRSSPHPIAHSPSPKPQQQVPSTPVSPHLSSRGASPRGAPSPWQPHHPPPPPPPSSLHSLSPHRPLTSPLPSPPPQG